MLSQGQMVAWTPSFSIQEGEGPDMEMPEHERAMRAGGAAKSAAVRAAIGVLVAITFGAVLGPAPAEANETFRIEFEDNRIDIGPIGEIPIGQITRGASIEGTVDPRGRVSIPKENFTLPVLGIDEPVEVRGFMGIEDDATGVWDPKTGKLEIQAKAGIWLSIDVAATLSALQQAGINIGNLEGFGSIIGAIAGRLTCGFSPMDVTFTTETTSFGTGQRFTKGLRGPGTLTAGWSRLGPFTGRTGAGLSGFACPLIRSLLPTLVTGLAGNAIPGLDLGGLDIESLLEGFDSLDLGPSSLSISRAVDESLPASLAMTSPRATIKARPGRPTRIPIRISNPGDVAASGVRICPRIPRPARAKGACEVVGSITPRSSVTRTLTVRPNRSERTRKRSARRSARKVRTVRLSIVVTGSGLPSQTRGVLLRVIG